MNDSVSVVKEISQQVLMLVCTSERDKLEKVLFKEYSKMSLLLISYFLQKLLTGNILKFQKYEKCIYIAFENFYVNSNFPFFYLQCFK